MRTLADIPPGVTILRTLRTGVTILECSHADDRDGVLCGACRSPEWETRPVKFIAAVTAPAEATLF